MNAIAAKGGHVRHLPETVGTGFGIGKTACLGGPDDEKVNTLGMLACPTRQSRHGIFFGVNRPSQRVAERIITSRAQNLERNAPLLHERRRPHAQTTHAHDDPPSSSGSVFRSAETWEWCSW